MDTCAWVGCQNPKSGKSKYCKTCKVKARANWKEMIANKGNEKADRDKKHADIWEKAHAAGVKAAEAHVPTPMVVVGGGYREVVDSGVCGFAWIVVHPGNSSFAIWAKKNQGARKEYGGGVCVKWVGEYGQSMERKEKYAAAFAEVLREAGIKAYSRSRMD